MSVDEIAERALIEISRLQREAVQPPEILRRDNVERLGVKR